MSEIKIYRRREEEHDNAIKGEASFDPKTKRIQVCLGENGIFLTRGDSLQFDSGELLQMVRQVVSAG